MAVKRRIEWSGRATGDIDRIYNYLIEEWGEREAEEFLRLIEEFISLIAHYPEAFAISKKNPACRLGLIHKNVTGVYLVRRTSVFIVTLFDNRTNSIYR